MSKTDDKWFYRLKKIVLTFIGDIKFYGWTHPLWIEVNSKGCGIKGRHYRQLKPLLQPGDILVRRFEGYVDKWLIPGWWNHAGIYIGDDKVVHAVSEGVLQEDILDFLRTDHLIALRVAYKSAKYFDEVVKTAKDIVGKEYDFNFDFTSGNRFSCTELVAYCHKGLLRPRRSWKSAWKNVIVADDIVSSDRTKIVWDSRNER